MSTEEETVRVRTERIPVYTDPDVPLALKALATSVGDFLREKRRCCLNCTHFDEATEDCGLAGKRPPARVIAFGCDAHDLLPF